MAERPQPLRRGHNLVMDAEQLDRQDSLARRDNKRVENRLRLKNGSLENHKSTNIYSLNHEMKKLKHELQGIKQTSGHFNLGSSSKPSQPRRRAREKTRARINKKSPEEREEIGDNITAAESVTRNNGNHEESSDEGNKNGQFLPVLCGTSNVRSPRIKDPNKEEKAPAHRTRFNASTDQIAKTGESNNTAGLAVLYPPEIEATSTNSIFKNHSAEKIDSSAKAGTASASSLGNLKMDAAKERIQNRLSTTNQVSYYDDSDITPFMHVPPDGMPRTVYLLPPLQDLLKEAKKARYIRRPKGDQNQDDPDRELNIDEIFGRKD